MSKANVAFGLSYALSVASFFWLYGWHFDLGVQLFLTAAIVPILSLLAIAISLGLTALFIMLIGLYAAVILAFLFDIVGIAEQSETKSESMLKFILGGLISIILVAVWMYVEWPTPYVFLRFELPLYAGLAVPGIVGIVSFVLTSKFL